ncbi:NUDIX domain-containing protein [Vibrio navarrensis]|uniref:NUDIX domain-containing protein n=1 Tax=Vibrio navarrensis TaxID=29495 RepID=UPI00338FB2FD
MPRVSVRAIVIENDQILLVRYKDSQGYWYLLPGGGVEDGETLEEAFARETYEECGVSLPFGDIVYVRDFVSKNHDESNKPKDFHQIDINVISSYSSDGFTLKPNLPDENQVGLVWHELCNLDKIRFYPKNAIIHLMNQNWGKVYLGDSL